MPTTFNESDVEEAAHGWLAELGYAVAHGAEIAPEAPGAERRGFGDVVLVERLRAALARINPGVPEEAREEALRQVTRATSGSLAERNRAFHLLLTDGVPVEYRRPDGSIAGDTVKLADFEDPARNDWLAVNQFVVVEGKTTRRPDIVVFLNGLPVAVLELKNPADENATIHGAFNQLQTYQRDIPALFPYNEVLVVSDGVEARAGTLTAEWERFMPWRTIEGDALAPKDTPELEVLIKGIFERRRFLDLLRHFIVFEVDGASVAKKMAAYHQFHAVNKAVEATAHAASPEGDRRVGVVWHTQGSGKSLSMVFYAGKIILHPALANPTIVVLTDRNDLDDQLFGSFALAHDLLRPLDAVIVAIHRVARHLVVPLMRLGIAPGPRLLDRQVRVLVEVHRDHPILGIGDVHNIHRLILDHVGAAPIEQQPRLLEAHAQKIEDVIERGAAVAVDAVLFQIRGPAETHVPGAVFTEQQVAELFLGSEHLALAHAQVLAGLA